MKIHVYRLRMVHIQIPPFIFVFPQLKKIIYNIIPNLEIIFLAAWNNKNELYMINMKFRN